MSVLNEPAYALDRRLMVQRQLRRRGISNERILAAMVSVPRHLFMTPRSPDQAYRDDPTPIIGLGQTISQPLVVALMLQALELEGHERVLEVGTGSGYAAALLGNLAAEVYTVEIVAELAESARRVLARLECDNVAVAVSDGSLGLPAHAPYDAIVVAAAGPRIPGPLVDQLAIGGRLVIPIGELFDQVLVRIRRYADRCEVEQLHTCRFVPLRGAAAWGL